ncbi:dTMP kinase [Silanimonas sp.]|jgi:dTMP kinase|uniref:dTMP kinase n=1 Tax=Silanimonas sp. TaxID=1929290 RepID=UPI0022C51C04|nr:dTMP kinase [Silanimonas sp.]MCZ8115131.1 dTMP kinase [Silanimonas sp.]
MASSRGALISLEGGEGAGKTTVLVALRARLEARGHAVVGTREPGGTPAGEAIRALLLDPAQPLVPNTELLLMFASRAQLVETLVEPALARGDMVLADRFTDASFAYQGGGRGLPMGVIADLERVFVGRVPDFTLLLDLDVQAGLARARSRGAPADRIEREKDEFFERVRGAYRARAAAQPQRIAVVDASQPVEAVVHDACAALDAFLDRWSAP